MKTFAKPILTTVNRKVPYQKYLDPHIFTQNHKNLPKYQTSQRQLVRVLAATSSRTLKRDPNRGFTGAKSGQNSQNLRSRAWVLEALSRSSSSKAARTWPSRNLIQGPSKGVQNGQNQVKFGVPQGPSKVLPGKGYK